MLWYLLVQLQSDIGANVCVTLGRSVFRTSQAGSRYVGPIRAEAATFQCFPPWIEMFFFFFLVNKTLKSRCWNLSGHWKGGTMAEGSAALPGRSECLDSTHPETCCFNCIPNMKEGARGFEVRAFGLESRIASILFQRADFFQGADFCKAVLEELATSSPLKWNDA